MSLEEECKSPSRVSIQDAWTGGWRARARQPAADSAGWVSRSSAVGWADSSAARPASDVEPTCPGKHLINPPTEVKSGQAGVRRPPSSFHLRFAVDQRKCAAS